MRVRAAVRWRLDRPLANFDVKKAKGSGTVRVLEALNTANSFTGKVEVDDPHGVRESPFW